MSVQVQDLQIIPLFQGMDISDIRLILPLVEEIHFDEGSIIFAQDQYADFFYVLLQGEVIIRYKPYDGPYLKVATIPEGDIFGWSSILRHECYTSDAISATESCTYRIAGASMQMLCQKHPATGLILLERLSRVINSRLNATQTEVTRMLQIGMQTQPDGREKEPGNE